MTTILHTTATKFVDFGLDAIPANSSSGALNPGDNCFIPTEYELSTQAKCLLNPHQISVQRNGHFSVPVSSVTSDVIWSSYYGRFTAMGTT